MRGTLRRIDFICGAASVLANPNDTWVDRDMDVAAVRDDHFPKIIEVIWQSELQPIHARWHYPLLDRTALVEGESAKLLRYRLALAPRPPGGTPAHGHHAFCGPPAAS